MFFPHVIKIINLNKFNLINSYRIRIRNVRTLLIMTQPLSLVKNFPLFHRFCWVYPPSCCVINIRFCATTTWMCAHLNQKKDKLHYPNVCTHKPHRRDKPRFLKICAHRLHRKGKTHCQKVCACKLHKKDELH